MSSRQDIDRFDRFFREAFDGKEAAHTPAEMNADWSAVQSHLPAAGSAGTAAGAAASGGATTTIVISSIVAVVTAALIAVVVMMSGNEQTSPAATTPPEAYVAETETSPATEAQPDVQQPNNVPSEVPASLERNGGTGENATENPRHLAEQPHVNGETATPRQNSPASTLSTERNASNAEPEKTVSVQGSVGGSSAKSNDQQQPEYNGVTSTSGKISTASSDLKLSAKEVCLNSHVVLTTASVPGATFYWLKGEGAMQKLEKNTSITFNQTGIKKLWIVKKVINGSNDTVVLNVTVHEVPESEFVADESRIPTVAFSNLSHGADRYEWNFGDGSVSSSAFSPEHVYNLSGIFYPQLIARNSYGCSDTFASRLEIKAESSFSLPNTFTPNGDGLNDKFEVQIKGETYFEFTVIDRSGNNIFSSRDKNNSWDGTDSRNGKAVPSGTYYYVLRYQLQGQSAAVTQTGAIALIRD